MEHSASIPQLGSEFDAFLFAPVGDDKNGMALSVLSALARLNVDPWMEAASLAQLPERAAIERLTSLIATLPDGPSVCRDPARGAARLIALLPRGADAEMTCKPLRGLNVASYSRAVARLILIDVVFIVLVLGAQWLASTPTQSPGSSATAPHTAPAPISTSNLGR